MLTLLSLAAVVWATSAATAAGEVIVSGFLVARGSLVESQPSWLEGGLGGLASEPKLR